MINDCILVPASIIQTKKDLAEELGVQPEDLKLEIGHVSSTNTQFDLINMDEIKKKAKHPDRVSYYYLVANRD